MGDWNGVWLWPFGAAVRLRSAVRAHWRRIVMGAFVGWLSAVIGGALVLAALELHDVISRSTSNELSTAFVLYGMGIGALNAYALRPVRP